MYKVKISHRQLGESSGNTYSEIEIIIHLLPTIKHRKK